MTHFVNHTPTKSKYSILNIFHFKYRPVEHMLSTFVRKLWTAMCKKIKFTIFLFFWGGGALNRHEEKMDFFLRALCHSFWKHVLLSVSFDLRKKPEQLAWLRNWLKSRLILTYLQVADLVQPGRHNVFLFSLSPEPPWRKKWIFGIKKSIFFLRALNGHEEKNVLGLIFKSRRFSTWPTLAQFSQHSCSAHFIQNWPVWYSAHFREYCVLGPLWLSLANSFTRTSLAKSGQ